MIKTCYYSLNTNIAIYYLMINIKTKTDFALVESVLLFISKTYQVIFIFNNYVTDYRFKICYFNMIMMVELNCVNLDITRN